MKLSKRLRPLLKHKEHRTYLTSLQYPIISVENFQAACALDHTKPLALDTKLLTCTNDEDVIATTKIEKVVLRDVLNKMSIVPDNFEVSAMIDGIEIRTLLNSMASKEESFSSSIVVNQIILSDALLSNKTQEETITAAVAIDKVILN